MYWYTMGFAIVLHQHWEMMLDGWEKTYLKTSNNASERN